MVEHPEPKLNFLFMDHLRGFFFNPFRPDGLTFAAHEPNQVDLSLKPSDPENDSGGIRLGLTCRARCTVNVPQSVHQFASLMLSGRFDRSTGATLKLPHVLNGEEKIDGSGFIQAGYHVPFEYFPTEVQTICDLVGSRLKGLAERFIKLLRWQQEIDGPHALFEGPPPLYWNAGGADYYGVGFRGQSSGSRSPLGITWDADDQREMLSIWSQVDLVEPLAHEMLREAKAAMVSSPRSALLIAASALEVGVKIHISKIAPEASWLAREMPSPPVHKMLRVYIRDLHVRRGTQLPDWDKLRPLLTAAEELAKARNDLTHKGEMPEKTRASLPEALMVVTDLLYILDVLEGHEWAKGNVRAATCRMLGWPKPRRARMFVRMTVGTA
jgi:hypothetical protein